VASPSGRHWKVSEKIHEGGHALATHVIQPLRYGVERAASATASTVTNDRCVGFAR